MEKNYTTVLKLFKIDLGINHEHRDEYFANLIAACDDELNGKGCKIDLNNVADVQLLTDYSVWKYRKRTEDVPLSQNLRLRIMNKKVKGRAASET